ncbi:MAG: hypothetical protein KY445_01070 [Armatimonadetes bacterium]|nr:hypothetical protein [Armatimonadota bacterium]
MPAPEIISPRRLRPLHCERHQKEQRAGLFYFNSAYKRPEEVGELPPRFTLSPGVVKAILRRLYYPER